MNRILILKLPRTKEIDNVLIDRYEAITDAQRAALDPKDWTYDNTLWKLHEIET